MCFPLWAEIGDPFLLLRWCQDRESLHSGTFSGPSERLNEFNTGIRKRGLLDNIIRGMKCVPHLPEPPMGFE